jgi:hypothetical protein
MKKEREKRTQYKNKINIIEQRDLPDTRILSGVIKYNTRSDPE